MLAKVGSNLNLRSYCTHLPGTMVTLWLSRTRQLQPRWKQVFWSSKAMACLFTHWQAGLRAHNTWISWALSVWDLPRSQGSLWTVATIRLPGLTVWLKLVLLLVTFLVKGNNMKRLVDLIKSWLSLGYKIRKKSDFGPMHWNSTILVGFFLARSTLRLWPSSQSWN